MSLSSRTPPFAASPPSAGLTATSAHAADQG